MTVARTTRGAVEAVWRIESARLLGGLVRILHDVDRAEDLAQEVLLVALERWPETGIPDNPGAWLMTAAKNRALDDLRRARRIERKHEQLARDGREAVAERHDFESEGVDDDVLRLMLVACHPILSKDARVALTLRLLGGLSTEEIARAFLMPEPSIAQRIVRAKRTLTEARVPFDVPRGAELAMRVPSVLEVIYLIFNEGYAATSGDHWMRPELCQDAMRLGRVLSGLLPEDAETFGLVALMELQASRMRARTDARGNPVLLLEQDRTRWDHTLLQHGLAALAQAERLARPLGPYTLQAAIAGCHARARTASSTDWARIAALYDALAELTGSPIVELNRAVAVAMAFGPGEGLDLLDALMASGALGDHHLLAAARGDLLEKVGRYAEAAAEFTRAASLAPNRRDQDVMRARASRRVP